MNRTDRLEEIESFVEALSKLSNDLYNIKDGVVVVAHHLAILRSENNLKEELREVFTIIDKFQQQMQLSANFLRGEVENDKGKAQ